MDQVQDKCSNKPISTTNNSSRKGIGKLLRFSLFSNVKKRVKKCYPSGQKPDKLLTFSNNKSSSSSHHTKFRLRNVSIFPVVNSHKKYLLSQYWAHVLPLLFIFVLSISISTVQAQANQNEGCPQPPPYPANGRVIGTELKCDDGFELFPLKGGQNVNFGQSASCDLEKRIWTINSYCAANVANNRPVNQSSTVSRQQQQQGISPASNCWSTGKEPNPWLRVDLLRFHSVLSVRVRAEGSNPINDLEIRVGNSTIIGKNPLCTWAPDGVKEGESELFTCARPLVGRYVSIQIVGEKETSMHACDLQVYSTDDIPLERCKPETSQGDIISYNGTCYEFATTTNGQTFSGARGVCKGRNGDLLTNLMDQPTINLITNKLESIKDKLKRPLIWIGVERDPGFTARTWRYVHNNEVIKKANWGKDQPNNYNGEQNCAVLDGGRDWGWNDVGCSLDYFHWICQFEPRVCGTPEKAAGTLILNEKSPSLYPVHYEVEYGCSEGHYLEYKKGNDKRTCMESGHWENIDELPTCHYANCGQLKLTSEFKNGLIQNLDRNRTDFGAKLKFVCEKDYLLDLGQVGQAGESLTLECGKNGQWGLSSKNFGRNSNLNQFDLVKNSPQCLYSKCPLPAAAEIINGTYESNGNSLGSTIKYKCNEGHLLEGSATLKCELGGKWDSDWPICRYVDCGEPRVQTNAHLDMSTFKSTSLGSIITYDCTENYDGGGDFVCSSDGKWTKTEDYEPCEMISCGKPEVPQGGFAIGYDYDVGSVIEYKCDIGYLLKGVTTRICLKNGDWSQDMPTCEYVDCGHSQASPYSTTMYLNGTTYLGSLVKYSCAQNYKLARTRVNTNGLRKCGPNGIWEGIVPKCEEIRCKQPIIPQNALITVTLNDRSSLKLINNDQQGQGQTYRIGSIVKFRCERGHILMGSSGDKLTCEDQGDWSGTIPNCTYIDCGLPMDIDNSEYKLINNQTHYGAQVLYECNQGYKALGSGSRSICGENGTWSNSAPFKCEVITCEKVKEARSNRVGSIAYYTCPLGQYLAGPRERKCLETGEWDGFEPNCLWTKCPPPPASESPLIRQINLNDSLIYNSIVEFHCSRGYELKGPNIITCNGTHWLPDLTVVVSKSRDSDGNTNGNSNGNGEELSMIPRPIQECVEISYNPADEIRTLPITLEVTHNQCRSRSGCGKCQNRCLYSLVFGLLIVTSFIGVLVYLKRGWGSKQNKDEMGRNVNHILNQQHQNGSGVGEIVHANSNLNGGSPMVVYSYYDNPNVDPIYDNIDGDDEDPYGFTSRHVGRSSDSVVTINGVAIS